MADTMESRKTGSREFEVTAINTKVATYDVDRLIAERGQLTRDRAQVDAEFAAKIEKVDALLAQAEKVGIASVAAAEPTVTEEVVP